MRKELQTEGVLQLSAEHLVFTQDFPFNSPSAAAAIVIGNNTNGWVVSRTQEGETLDAVVRQAAG